MGGECARGGLHGGWGGNLLSEGLRDRGFHLVITQVIPAGGGPDKEVVVLISVRVRHFKRPGV